MPADAFVFLTWPAIIGSLLAGAAYGAAIQWQFVARRLRIRDTTLLSLGSMVFFFTFLTVLRAATPGTPNWGLTIGTGIEGAVFGLGIGLGLALRHRCARV